MQILNRLFPFLPRRRYVWIRVRILHETDKAVLVLHDDRKLWLPKSCIHSIRLRNCTFEIRIKQTAFG